MKNESINEGMSLSKQRKQLRKEQIEKQKKQAVINKILIIGVSAMVLALIVWGIVSASIKKANSVTPDGDYSAQINDDGRIKGVKASECVKLPDYNNISAAMSDIEYPDEDVETDIEDILNQNKYIDDSAELVAANGDTVNIDFAGTVDGEAFDGGTSEGFDLELGSGSFVDDFEEQIEGHCPGDEFTVEVTFPDPYENDETLAGRDAVFTVKLNGIYVAPEFTDEFVAENLSEYASTADGYRQYLKDTNYEDNLIAYVQDYLADNSTIISMPKKYLQQMKANYKAYEYSNCQYMNSLYSSYYGYEPYATFGDYLAEAYGMTETEYDASLEDKVIENMRYVLACQAIAEAEGITASVDEAREYYTSHGGTADNFDSMLGTYGTGYMAQQLLCEKVVNTLCDRTTVK